MPLSKPFLFLGASDKFGRPPNPVIPGGKNELPGFGGKRPFKKVPGPPPFYSEEISDIPHILRMQNYLFVDLL